MIELPESLIRSIHDSGHSLVLAVTGGGSQALSALLSIPGASRSVLEAIVPYSAESLHAWLQARPEQACSAATARAMAMAAWQRTAVLGGQVDPGRRIGLGATASLASDRPKRGEHRIHIAIQTLAATIGVSLVLEKGARSRFDEEQLAARLILDLLAEACGVMERLDVGLLPSEHRMREAAFAPTAWQHLFLGSARLAYRDNAWRSGEQLSELTIFPGAFNPLHAGHRQMAELAARYTHRPVWFELAVRNVDKPPIDYLEIERRAAQFSDPLVLTTAPTFVEKSLLFPQSTFVVGVDTIRRIADPRYYGGSETAMLAALERIAQQACRFLVFGRLVEDRFHSLEDVPLPELLRAICDAVPEAAFRADISSTEIRRSPDGE